MERKFKVGDTIRTPNEIVGKVVFVSPLTDALYPYLIEYSDSTYEMFGEADLTLVPKYPEPKYNVGDNIKVSAEGIEPFEVQVTSWVNAGSRYFYTFEIKGGTAGAHSIEPRWQYKPKEEFPPYKYEGSIPTQEEAKRFYEKEAEKWHAGQVSPAHPYTVILKSGVKVGVDEQTAKGIILLDGETCHRIDGTDYFVKSEIAAIVPTENIVA